MFVAERSKVSDDRTLIENGAAICQTQSGGLIELIRGAANCVSDASGGEGATALGHAVPVVALAMTTAELILEYVKTLIWPTLIVVALILLRGPIRGLAQRVSDESEEISADAFGIKMSATFRQRLQNLAEADDTDAPGLRESVKQAADDLARDQFRALASNFVSPSVEVRRQTARAVGKLASDLRLDDVLGYARSPSNGERVGGAIALRIHLEDDSSLCADARVRAALAELLDDPRSGVRYRAVEAVQACPELASAFVEDLRRLANEDRNRNVRRQAGVTLGISAP